MGTELTGAALLNSFLSIVTLDVAVTDAKSAARQGRIDSAVLAFNIVEAGAETAETLAEIMKTAVETTPSLKDCAGAYTSGQGMGLWIATGELLSLPGNLPDNVVISSIPGLIKDYGIAKSRDVERETNDVAQAFGVILKGATRVREAKRAEKNRAKSDYELLKAASGTIDTAVLKPSTSEGASMALSLAHSLLERYLPVDLFMQVNELLTADDEIVVPETPAALVAV